MANFNRVFLIGNLTRDIELRYTQGGTAIAKTGIAVNRKWEPKDGGEIKEEVTFVDLTCFGAGAEVLNEHVGKGSPLFVEGRLHYSTWTTDAGDKRNKLEVIVQTFQFLGGKRGDGGGKIGVGTASTGTATPRPGRDDAIRPEDIPF